MREGAPIAAAAGSVGEAELECDDIAAEVVGELRFALGVHVLQTRADTAVEQVIDADRPIMVGETPVRGTSPLQDGDTIRRASSLDASRFPSANESQFARSLTAARPGGNTWPKSASHPRFFPLHRLPRPPNLDCFFTVIAGHR